MYITDFDNYCKDVIQHVNVVKDRHKNLPFFIVGHSMVSTSPRRRQEFYRCKSGSVIGIGDGVVAMAIQKLSVGDDGSLWGS